MELSAKELADQICQQMTDNLRVNVAADKARRKKVEEQLEKGDSMNGVCC